MSTNPNKLSQLWQELKRRKVIRTITVYATAAFVFLELLSIVIEPLRLPDWTLQFAIVFLCIGFIIAIILSWIYDIHPEEGIVKTEPADKVKIEDIPKSSNSWKIASYFSFVVILGLVMLNIFGSRQAAKIDESIDKSIALRPFKSLSDDPEKQYLADGVMDAILLDLSKIKDLKVLPNTSVEQYRETDKTASEICKELDVAYLLEGHFQKYGDKASLIVWLIESGKEDPIWTEKYDKDWKDIFSVQSEVAQTIAKEIQAFITPEEKQLIEKAPTTSLTAYDQYLKANAEYLRFLINYDNTDALDRAESLFRKALEYDPEFSQAYAGLGWARYRREQVTSVFGTYFSSDYFEDEQVDSVEILTKLALQFDDQNVDALILSSYLDLGHGKVDEAKESIERALEINPNHPTGLRANGTYGWFGYDYILSIKSLQKALKIERGNDLPLIYRDLYFSFWQIGFTDESKSFLNELTSLSGDSVMYYTSMSRVESVYGNPQKEAEYTNLAYELDSQHTRAIISMGDLYYYNRQYREAYPYFHKHLDRVKEAGQVHLNYMHRMAHVLLEMDRKEEAMHLFNKYIELADECLRRMNFYGLYGANYDLAGVYAFLGEKEKAYAQLEDFLATNFQIAYIIEHLKERDPLFESIRSEERFQQILADAEAKYQAEHERVRQWLEENDVL